MGRNRGDLSICRECMPDYEQRSGVDEKCEVDKTTCPLGKTRELGSNFCSRCPAGTYYNDATNRDANNPSTWSDRCVDCPVGEYTVRDVLLVNQCVKCHPGTYQSSLGSKECIKCPAGKFQTEFGKDSQKT